jgi:hypothetical protein
MVRKHKTLKMETLLSSETLATTHAIARRQNPEDHNVQNLSVHRGSDSRLNKSAFYHAQIVKKRDS